MRFVVVSRDEAIKNCWCEADYCGDKWQNVLYDTSTTPPTEIGSDGGEPEDQTLVRDWRWVPKILNKLANEIEQLRGGR